MSTPDGSGLNDYLQAGSPQNATTTIATPVSIDPNSDTYTSSEDLLDLEADNGFVPEASCDVDSYTMDKLQYTELLEDTSSSGNDKTPTYTPGQISDCVTEISTSSDKTTLAEATSSESGATFPVKKKKKSVLPTFLPPCKVCNAKASGFHYGANTCEACKAFFRRSIGHEDSIKPCTVGGQCAENPSGKIACSDCRLRKCWAIGMAKKGCRKGRYTYEKRTQDTKEIRRMQASESETRQVEENCCEDSARQLTETFKSCFVEICFYLERKDAIKERIQNLVLNEGVSIPLQRPIFSPGPNSDLLEWVHSFRQALQGTIENGECVASDMIFEVWMAESERFFHCYAQFAKNLPGYSDLLLDDRIILLKQARGDSLNLMRHHMADLRLGAAIRYRYETDDLAIVPLDFMKQLIDREFVEGVMRTTRRLQKLKLTDEDIAVLLAFIILTPDRDGLQEPYKVEKLQEMMIPVLQYTLKKNHPDQRNIIADTFLIFPLLRENSVINVKAMSRLRHRIQKERFPLVFEMTSHID